jgi:hypothetical protein
MAADTTYAQSVVADQVRALSRALDAGLNGGKVLIYTAPRPASGFGVTTQTLLCEQQFPKPCELSVSGTLLTLKDPTPSLALADGQAAWARFTDSEGGFVADGDCGPIGSNTTVELSSLVFYQGGQISLESITLTAGV